MVRPLIAMPVAATAFLLAVMPLGVVSCVTPPRPAASSELTQAAKAVVDAFAAKDAEALASWSHPQKGVRFSPYAYVNVENDVVFSAAQIERFWTDPKTYRWGFADGSGEPLVMTPSEYCDRYVFDRDFRDSSSISVNDDQASGNRINNAASVYPDASRVEYYIEPSTSGGLDWAALRLVFERDGDAWRLVGVIHDEWTI